MHINKHSSFPVTQGSFRILISLVIAVFGSIEATETAAKEKGQSDGEIVQSQVVGAVRLNRHEIVLDGRLDESVWSHAETVRDFTQDDPDRGAAPSEETMFMVVYDDHALYVGVACNETNVMNISSVLCRRDRIENSDYVSICIDPYHGREALMN